MVVSVMKMENEPEDVKPEDASPPAAPKTLLDWEKVDAIVVEEDGDYPPLPGTEGR
jgi:hypothetical protein